MNTNFNVHDLTISDFRLLESIKEFDKEIARYNVVNCMSWPGKERLLYVDNDGRLWGMKDWSDGELKFYKYKGVDNVTSIG